MMRVTVELLLIGTLLCFVSADSCLTTLYQRDIFHNGIDFSTGRYSTAFQDYLPVNQGVDIVYGEYKEIQFTIAPEGSKVATFYDLGDVIDVREHYGISTTPMGSEYSSIHFSESDLVIVKSYGGDTGRSFQNMDASVLNRLEEIGIAAPSFTPVSNHIYLIRITNPNDDSSIFDRWVKLFVPEVVDGEHVVVRWDVIRDASASFTGQECVCQPDQVTIQNPSVGHVDMESDAEYSTSGWVTACIVILFLLYFSQWCVNGATFIYMIVASFMSVASFFASRLRGRTSIASPVGAEQL